MMEERSSVRASKLTAPRPRRPKQRTPSDDSDAHLRKAYESVAADWRRAVESADLDELVEVTDTLIDIGNDIERNAPDFLEETVSEVRTKLLATPAESPSIQLQLLRLLEARHNSWQLPLAAEQYYLSKTQRLLAEKPSTQGTTTSSKRVSIKQEPIETSAESGGVISRTMKYPCTLCDAHLPSDKRARLVLDSDKTIETKPKVDIKVDINRLVPVIKIEKPDDGYEDTTTGEMASFRETGFVDIGRTDALLRDIIDQKVKREESSISGDENTTHSSISYHTAAGASTNLKPSDYSAKGREKSGKHRRSPVGGRSSPYGEPRDGRRSPLRMDLEREMLPTHKSPEALLRLAFTAHECSVLSQKVLGFVAMASDTTIRQLPSKYSGEKRYVPVEIQGSKCQTRKAARLLKQHIKDHVHDSVPLNRNAKSASFIKLVPTPPRASVEVESARAPVSSPPLTRARDTERVPQECETEGEDSESKPVVVKKTVRKEQGARKKKSYWDKDQPSGNGNDDSLLSAWVGGMSRRRRSSVADDKQQPSPPLPATTPKGEASPLNRQRSLPDMSAQRPLTHSFKRSMSTTSGQESEADSSGPRQIGASSETKTNPQDLIESIEPGHMTIDEIRNIPLPDEPYIPKNQFQAASADLQQEEMSVREGAEEGDVKLVRSDGQSEEESCRCVVQYRGTGVTVSCADPSVLQEISALLSEPMSGNTGAAKPAPELSQSPKMPQKEFCSKAVQVNLGPRTQNGDSSMDTSAWSSEDEDSSRWSLAEEHLTPTNTPHPKSRVADAITQVIANAVTVVQKESSDTAASQRHRHGRLAESSEDVSATNNMSKKPPLPPQATVRDRTPTPSLVRCTSEELLFDEEDDRALMSDMNVDTAQSFTVTTGPANVNHFQSANRFAALEIEDSAPSRESTTSPRRSVDGTPSKPIPIVGAPRLTVTASDEHTGACSAKLATTDLKWPPTSNKHPKQDAEKVTSDSAKKECSLGDVDLEALVRGQLEESYVSVESSVYSAPEQMPTSDDESISSLDSLTLNSAPSDTGPALKPVVREPLSATSSTEAFQDAAKHQSARPGSACDRRQRFWSTSMSNALNHALQKKPTPNIGAVCYGREFLLACAQSPNSRTPPADWQHMVKLLPDICFREVDRFFNPVEFSSPHPASIPFNQQRARSTSRNRENQSARASNPHIEEGSWREGAGGERGFAQGARGMSVPDTGKGTMYEQHRSRAPTRNMETGSWRSGMGTSLPESGERRTLRRAYSSEGSWRQDSSLERGREGRGERMRMEAESVRPLGGQHNASPPIVLGPMRGRGEVLQAWARKNIDKAHQNKETATPNIDIRACSNPFTSQVREDREGHGDWAGRARSQSSRWSSLE